MEVTVGISVIIGIAFFLVAQYRENKKTNREYGSLQTTVETHDRRITDNKNEIANLDKAQSEHRHKMANITMLQSEQFARMEANLVNLVNNSTELKKIIQTNDKDNRVEQGKIYDRINDLSAKTIKAEAEIGNLKDA